MLLLGKKLEFKASLKSESANSCTHEDKLIDVVPTRLNVNLHTKTSLLLIM